jgi:hypothetical protein
MTQTNASRRLNRILRDEDYGARLVRLNRTDQRRILDLIDANRGAQARREILRLDAERIARSRVHRRALRYAHLPEDQRAGDGRPDEIREFWAEYDKITGFQPHRARAA